MQKRIILAAIFLGTAVLGLFYVMKSKDTLSVIAEMDHYDATTTSAVMHMTYPKSSPSLYPEIYTYINKTKNDFSAQFANLSKEEIKSEYGRADVQFELFIDTKIATSSKTVSYVIRTYEYAGGAHGGTTINTFTYDFAGKYLTLDDVFTGDYLTTIATHAKKYVYENFSQYSQPQMMDPGVEAKVENYLAWYLTEDAIHFIFQEYQIGPYAMGIEEFPLMKSEIENILNPTFR